MVGKAILFTEHRLPNITMFEDVHETTVKKTVLVILLLHAQNAVRLSFDSNQSQSKSFARLQMYADFNWFYQ